MVAVAATACNTCMWTFTWWVLSGLWMFTVCCQDPYTFPSYHASMREPYDYYAFGQNYIKPLIDYE